MSWPRCWRRNDAKGRTRDPTAAAPNEGARPTRRYARAADRAVRPLARALRGGRSRHGPRPGRIAPRHTRRPPGAGQESEGRQHERRFGVQVRVSTGSTRLLPQGHAGLAAASTPGTVIGVGTGGHPAGGATTIVLTTESGRTPSHPRRRIAATPSPRTCNPAMAVSAHPRLSSRAMPHHPRARGGFTPDTPGRTECGQTMINGLAPTAVPLFPEADERGVAEKDSRTGYHVRGRHMAEVVRHQPGSTPGDAPEPALDRLRLDAAQQRRPRHVP
ncbi:hypothetical protein SUDANB176_07323 [Streptomyces sp. enrichment culture]